MIAGPAHGPGIDTIPIRLCETGGVAATLTVVFVDEPCRIRGVQFDHPQIGVIASLANDPIVDRCTGRRDLPAIGSGWPRCPAKCVCCTVSVADNQYDTAGHRIAPMHDGGEIARGMDPA